MVVRYEARSFTILFLHHLMARCLCIEIIPLLHFYRKNGGTPPPPSRFCRFTRLISLESEEVNQTRSVRGWCMHAWLHRVALIAFLITRSIWRSAAVASGSTVREYTLR
jgi:hypothetical protein